MKSITKFIFLLPVMLASFVVNSAPVQCYEFLNYFDQLNAYRGKPGNYFVRDAAGKTTGMHGDPTVNKGWAIYTWHVPTKKWIKIAEEETIDASMSELLLNGYAKESMVRELIDEMYSKIVGEVATTNELEKIRVLLTELKNRVTPLENDTANLRQSLISVNNSIARVELRTTTVETKATENANQIDVLKNQISGLNNSNVAGISQLSNRLNRVEASVELESGRIDRLENGLEGVTNQIPTIVGNIHSLSNWATTAYGQLDSRVSENTTMIRGVTNDVYTNIRTITNDLNTIHVDMNAMSESVTNVINGLSSHQSESNGRFQQITNDLNVIHTDMNEMSDNLNKSSAQISSLSNSVMGVIGVTGELRTQITQIESNAGKLATSVTNVINDLDSHKSASDNRFQQITNDVAKASEFMLERIALVSNGVSQVSALVGELETRLSKVETSLKTLNIGDPNETTIGQIYDALNDLKK